MQDLQQHEHTHTHRYVNLKDNPKACEAVEEFKHIYREAMETLYTKTLQPCPTTLPPCPKMLQEVKTARDFMFYEAEKQLSMKNMSKARRKELETLKNKLVQSLTWSSKEFHPSSKMESVARETMSVLRDVLREKNKDPEKTFSRIIYDTYTSKEKERTTMGGAIVELVVVASILSGLLKLEDDIEEVHWVGYSKTDSNICYDVGLNTTKDRGIDVVIRLKHAKYLLIQIK